MKTLHYYLVAFAVTGVFFALLVLASSDRSLSTQAAGSGYNARSAQNPNDQTDPAARALAAQHAKQHQANLAIAGPTNVTPDDHSTDFQPK